MKNLMAVAFAVSLVGVMTGCGSGVRDVKYLVTGDTSSVEIQARVDKGDIFDEKDIKLPWEKEFALNVKWPLRLWVKNQGSLSFTAQIFVNGELVAEGTGSGLYDELELTYDGSSQARAPTQQKRADAIIMTAL